MSPEPSAVPDESDPILAALDAAPEADDDMTPEQHAEYEAAVVRYEAGQAHLVPYEDMPAALEEIGRSPVPRGMSLRIAWDYPALARFYELEPHEAMSLDRAVIRFAETGQGT